MMYALTSASSRSTAATSVTFCAARSWPFAAPHGGQQERLAFSALTGVVTARFSLGGRGSEITKICGNGAVAFPRSLGQVEAD
jgi:hypothetical protein